jgi:transporter family-2 protein
MNANFLYFSIAIIAGLAVTIQAGVNNELQISIKHPLTAALISFIIGAFFLAILILISQPKEFSTFANISTTSWWKLTGGLLGAIYICSLIFIIPKIGAANAIGFAVAAQLIFSVIFDHFAWAGFPHNPINWQRMLGIVLLVLGLFFLKK